VNDSQQTPPAEQCWATGDVFGLEIPATPEALLAGGSDFLTQAFHASGALAPENRVERIESAQAFFGGGTGKKQLLTLRYASPAPGLPTQLFVKYSRNFDHELWDRARQVMVSEAKFAVLSRTPDFPVAVPTCLFADVEAASGTGLIITECIPYGRDGVEPLYPKCMDFDVPKPVEHYQAILRGLARLSGTHRSGRLPAAFDREFPYDGKRAAAAFAIGTPLEKLVQRAQRMFDFIERYPRLFPDNVRAPAFHQQFLRDLPDVVAAEAKIRNILYGAPELIAFAHWNANIDNCWFWRDAAGELQAGFIDWANAGQLSVAQSISGAISGAEPAIWNDHLDELLAGFVDEFAAQGGPHLRVDQLRLHILLIVAVSGVAYGMGAPIAVEREITNIDTLESYRDERFRQHENARIQLHMMTKMLNVWETRKLGDMIRRL
jgi:hypothetical protein